MLKLRTTQKVFMLVIAFLACQWASMRPTAARAGQQGGIRARANVATPDPAGWRGWARCQVDVQGPGYADQQIHTWTMTGGTPTIEGAFRVYPGTWSVVGEGWSESTQSSQTRTMEWATNVKPMDAPIAVFVRASDGRIVISPRHAQLRSSSAVAGYDEVISRERSRPAISISGDAFEMTFPAIEGSAASEILSGSSTPGLNGSIGYMQKAGSRSNATCVWQFGQGASAPVPPPLLEARAIPTPSSTGPRRRAPGSTTASPDLGPLVSVTPGAPTANVPGAPTATVSAPGLPAGTGPGTPSGRRDPTDLPPVRVPSTKAFTASGSFTVPEGVSRVVVELWGAGGGGSNGNSSHCNPPDCGAGIGGHGGGSGAYTSVVLSVGKNTVFDVVVGRGGAAEEYGEAAGDGSATQIKQGSTVLAVAEGGKGSGAGGAKSGASGALARAGFDGAPGGSPPAKIHNTGPLGLGTEQHGGAAGPGGSSPNPLSSPAVASGGSGGAGGGWTCAYSNNCKVVPASRGGSGLDGYALITW